MLRRVALVGSNVSHELIASIIRLTIIGELGTLAVTSSQKQAACCVTDNDSCHLGDGGETFFRNVGNIPEDRIPNK
jgi:hypothetical protein